MADRFWRFDATTPALYSPSVVGATPSYVLPGLLIERQLTALRPNSLLKRSTITEQY